MAELHTLNVSSGPTSKHGGSVEKIEPNDLTFPQLQAAKDKLESEIQALGRLLQSHNVDMKTSLLTPDGYPRADLDIAQIRSTRARINFLLGDLKELMVVIENRLHAHFASLASNNGLNIEAIDLNGKNSNSTSISASNAVIPNSSSSGPKKLTPPFAKVNSIMDKSPAESAGLRVGDLIRNFGNVDHSNHDGLKRMSECVQGNEERNIHVKVARTLKDNKEQELDLILKPSRSWGGKGLLGCHILPYSNV